MWGFAGVYIGSHVQRSAVFGVRHRPLEFVCVGIRTGIKLSRLCRYIARPPLAKSRLETREDGTVVIRLKQPRLMGRVPSNYRGWS
jgi:hypothetical protein